jgi:beta-lactamase superfamily II metal-dependent hydrolase
MVAGLVLAWLCAWLAAAAAGTLTVTILDVGQGDAVLVQAPGGKTALIDAGDGTPDVVAMLRARGVDHLDLVVASHPHADHIGGMKAVIEAFPPRLYVDSGQSHTTAAYDGLMAIVEARDLPYQVAHTGSSIALGPEVTLDVLLPGDTLLRDTRSDLNSNSVVLRLRHGADCFLFTGDAEEPTESRLLDQGLEPCGVLKVAHHGSAYATSERFLSAVRPKLALVSAGAANRYGHPAPEALSRLQAAGATAYRTDRSGSIVVTSTGKGITVTTERDGGAVADAAEPASAAPAAARSPPSDPPTPATSCPFLASKASEVFHEASCGNGEKIKPENRACFPTREAALAAGKRAAGCCHP